MNDFTAMRRYSDNHPSMTLDHIVKEHYPTFIDALRDLDDCLTLCFLFNTFPSMHHIPRDQMILCRRLEEELDIDNFATVNNTMRKIAHDIISQHKNNT